MAVLGRWTPFHPGVFRPAEQGFEEYLSDPGKPVPYVGRIVQGILSTYMTEDQRFAAMRPDVLVFKTEP